jgi:hypothetical protein
MCVKNHRFCGVALSLCAAGAGCDLVSNDLTKVTVQLPVETYMVDTMDHQNLRLPQMIPTATCMTDSTCCPAGCQGDGYTFSCGSGATCQATIVPTLVERIDLSTNPDLTRAKSFSQVTLKSVSYGVCANTLTVAMPQVAIWIAPETVTRPDPSLGAKKLGVVPAIPAQTDVTCPPDLMHIDPSKLAKVTLDAAAVQTFASLIGTAKTAFNVIVVATLVQRAGDPVPTGSATMLVTGSVSAALSF